MSTEHGDRIDAMLDPDQPTRDLSPNDVAAIRRLRDERERLVGLLLGQAENTPIHSAGIRDGAIDIALRPPHWAILSIAASFLETLDNAPNWRSISIGPVPSDGGMLIATVHRATGETPTETVGKLRAELARLRAENERLRDEVDRYKTGAGWRCADCGMGFPGLPYPALGPPPPGERCSRCVWLEVLKAENARLRDEADESRELLHRLARSFETAEAENARLRAAGDFREAMP